MRVREKESLSERIEYLREEAKEQGYLTFDQILETVPEAEDNLGALEDLFTELYAEGISVYENAEEWAEEEMGDMYDEELEEEESSDAPDLSGISSSNAVSLYFKEMSHVPLLTREEEIELAKAMERGEEAEERLAENNVDPDEREELRRLVQEGKDARAHLIKANTRLVVSVAKKYRGHGMPFLDLIQAGNLGLIKAADKFDYRKGNKFSTYATWWIRQSVTRTLAQQGRTIRIPVHMSDRIRKLYKTSQDLEQDLGRRPTPEELAEEMGMEPSKVRWLLRISRRALSLEKPVGEEEETELGHFIEDESVPSPSETAEQRLLRESLEQMMGSLTPREARILRLRFGLHDGRTYTLKEIGDKLGVTRERIRQIARKALRKLRHPRHRRKLQ